MAIRAVLLLVLILAGLLAVAAPAAAVDVPPDHPVGDFNGDYHSDLAVGVPAEEVGGVYYAGAVNVVYGGPDGLRVEANQLIDQSGDVYGTPQTGALFGGALAAGDFDGDGYDDLAVGAPFYDEGGVRDCGLVVLLYGSPAGLAPREGCFPVPARPRGPVRLCPRGRRVRRLPRGRPRSGSAVLDLSEGPPRA